MESEFEARVLAELAALKRELQFVVDDVGSIKSLLEGSNEPDSGQEDPARRERR